MVISEVQNSMINTKEELLKTSAAAVLVSDELLKELRALCPQIPNKKTLTRHSIELVRKAGKPSRKGIGGRKAMPEPEDASKLEGKELLRYRNRIWKRESRKRLGQESNGV